MSISMKTAALIIASLMLLAALAAGCQPNTQPPEVILSGQTENPQSVQDTIAPAQSDKPFDVFDFPALAGMQLSYNQAAENYGVPISACAYYQAADGKGFLCLDFEEVYLELSGLPEELAVTEGSILERMSSEERAMYLNLEKIWVKRDTNSLFSVRGTGIGSAKEDVLRSFLNKGDGTQTLYTISDINPEWQSDWTDSFVGGRILSGENAAVYTMAAAEGGIESRPVPIACDEIISYTYVNSFQEYPLTGPGQWNSYVSLEYYISGQSVRAIVMRRFTDPE